MIQRSSITIDKDKSEEFIAFMKKNAKDPQFWAEIKEAASSPINKEELDALFEK